MSKEIKVIMCPEGLPLEGITELTRMAAHISRREPGRVVIGNETLPPIFPRRKSSKENVETTPDFPKIKIIFQWPLGSGRKRY